MAKKKEKKEKKAGKRMSKKMCIRDRTSTYHINDTEGIQICISFEEKNNGSILTLSQSGRILPVSYTHLYLFAIRFVWMTLQRYNRAYTVQSTFVSITSPFWYLQVKMCIRDRIPV